jgi:hypothetical protein
MAQIGRLLEPYSHGCKGLIIEALRLADWEGQGRTHFDMLTSKINVALDL